MTKSTASTRVRPQFAIAAAETIMPGGAPHKHHPIHDVPDELVPGLLPAEPDDGPASATPPDSPEDDRVIDPET